MKYKQLSYEERIQIDVLKRNSVSIRGIAAVLERSPNTISRELKEKTVRGRYVPKKAQHKTYWRRYISKHTCLKVALDGDLSRFVEAKLYDKWSPERISGYLRRTGVIVSTKAIYKYTRRRCLDHLLFWGWNKKKGGRKVKNSPGFADGRLYIDDRPELDGSGHFEADFVVSRYNTACLLVVVDRHTRYTTIRWLPNRKRTTIHRAFSHIFRDQDVKTLTLDNDIAFQAWKQLPYSIYFTHPYCSWEKGLVENTNRWIRCFVPKKSDLSLVTDADLCSITLFLNNLPRQCLGFFAPAELYSP